MLEGAHVCPPSGREQSQGLPDRPPQVSRRAQGPLIPESLVRGGVLAPSAAIYVCLWSLKQANTPPRLASLVPHAHPSSAGPWGGLSTLVPASAHLFTCLHWVVSFPTGLWLLVLETSSFLILPHCLFVQVIPNLTFRLWLWIQNPEMPMIIFWLWSPWGDGEMLRGAPSRLKNCKRLRKVTSDAVSQHLPATWQQWAFRDRGRGGSRSLNFTIWLLSK